MNSILINNINKTEPMFEVLALKLREQLKVFLNDSGGILSEKARFKSYESLRLFWFRITVNLFSLGVWLFLI